MIKKYPLKCCPWCGTTGSFRLDCNEKVYEKNFLVKIYCNNVKCNVQPCTKVIAIRKSQRKKVDWISKKIQMVVDIWNHGNMDYKGEGFCVDLEKIVKDYLDGNLGFSGYRQE